MDKQQQIRDSLRRIAGEVGPLNTLLAQLVSVDEVALTCELIADGAEVYDVRLCPVLNGKQSIVFFPAVNSWVLCARIEHDEDWMIIAADEIYKYRITIGTQVFEMDGTKFLIKNGTDNLKTMMDDFFTAILNMTFTTNTGVTMALINAPDFVALKTRFDNILKSV